MGMEVVAVIIVYLLQFSDTSTMNTSQDLDKIRNQIQCGCLSVVQVTNETDMLP